MANYSYSYILPKCRPIFIFSTFYTHRPIYISSSSWYQFAKQAERLIVFTNKLF